MPDWIVATTIGTVCLAAFLGAVAGVLIARKVIHMAMAHNEAHERVPTKTEADQVLDLARDLRGLINAAALDQDLRGGTCNHG